MDSSKPSRVGEIVLLNFPFTNQRGSKVRPAVIISESADNFGDFLVAYITGEVDSYLYSKYAMVFDQDDLKSGTIAKQSVIRVDKVIVISENVIARPAVALLKPAKIDKMLRLWAQLVVENHYKAVHLPPKQAPFIPVESRIAYAGRVYDEQEIGALIHSSLDFWLTTGRYAREFEDKFASFLGVKYCSLTNSGSSANLLAFMALTSPKLGDRQILPGDEVITVAAAFPTTVAPMIQYGAIPVFVDVDIPTYNIDCSQLEHALSDKTKAAMLAHTLGNPFNLKAVKTFCDDHGLWLIEDNCDALGSKYNLAGQWVNTGTTGHLGTFSFYPAHHITMGEGGAVVTNDPLLKRLVESFRDWGRDCSCDPGQDNRCGKRFDQQLGDLPYGFDHKYVYSHLGYNLKLTEMQAAIGVAQLDKLPDFIKARKRNFQALLDGLRNLEDFFIFPVATQGSDPSWFGFPLTVRSEAPFERLDLIRYLESQKIATRLLFGGNIVRQPCMTGHYYRQIGDLTNTDRIMNDTFWLGVYPGLTSQMIDFILSAIRHFCHE
ncbi:MAG: lipopolysaccharide biosynthesis protein RfbH [Desulfomonilaceae bacterium]